MWLFLYLFLAVVCHTNSDYDVSSIQKYQIYKATWKYYDTYINTPYLETEKTTCELSIKVIHNMLNMSAPDIWNSVRTASKQLDKMKSIVEGGDDERCVQDISNSWNDFVLQETNSFKQQLQSALIEQKNQQTFVSEVFKNYTLTRTNMNQSLEGCENQDRAKLLSCAVEARTRFENGRLRTLVVTGKITGRREKFLRPCMTAFESSVLRFHTERSERIVAEIGRMRTNLYKCSNQTKNSNLTETIASFEVPAALNSSSSIKVAQKLYEDALDHIWIALDAFLEVDIKRMSTFLNTYYHLETVLWKRPQRHFSDYIDAEEKVFHDNPDLLKSKCSSVRRDILNIVRTGMAEIDVCMKTYIDIILKNLSEGGEKFKNITGELSQAGNVAILDCINDPYNFQTNRTEECSMLKFSRFNNMWDKVEKEIEDIKATLNVYLGNKEGVPSSLGLCRNFLYQKMVLRASKALYDFRKCLYLETGIQYDVTLPEPPTVPFNLKQPSVPSTLTPTTDSPSTSSS